MFVSSGWVCEFNRQIDTSLIDKWTHQKRPCKSTDK